MSNRISTGITFVGLAFFASSLLAQSNNEPKQPKESANLRVTIGKYSEQGKKKPFMDDAVYVKQFGGATLYIAADGMGSGWVGDKSNGLIATEYAFNVISRELTKALKEARTEDDVRKLVRRALVAANEEIMTQEKKPEHKTMGAQIVLALWRPNDGLYVAGIGIGRVYLVRDNAITQLTVDHTLAQALLETKKISPDEAKESKFRNVIWKYLGSNEVSDCPEVKRIPARSNDRFLLCTHGLHEAVADDQILKCMREHEEPQKCATALCKLAFDSGARLDVSSIVIDIK